MNKINKDLRNTKDIMMKQRVTEIKKQNKTDSKRRTERKKQG